MRGAAAVTYYVGRERVVGDSNPQRQGNGLSTVGHAAVKLVKVKLVKQQEAERKKGTRDKFVESKTYTVDSLITHTSRWTAQGMGY